MAFDAEFKSIYKTFSSIDSKIKNDDSSEFGTQYYWMNIQFTDTTSPMYYIASVSKITHTDRDVENI